MAEQAVRKTRGLFDTSRGKRVFGEGRQKTADVSVATELENAKESLFFFFFSGFGFSREKKN